MSLLNLAAIVPFRFTGCCIAVAYFETLSVLSQLNDLIRFLVIKLLVEVSATPARRMYLLRAGRGSLSGLAS